MSKGQMTRIKNAFDVFSETYPTHAPALISSFNEWLENEFKRLNKQDENVQEASP